MAVPDLSELKIILRSILTSAPAYLTVAQLLNDYTNLEGSPLPYRELGFSTVYELLITMNDIFQVS